MSFGGGGEVRESAPAALAIDARMRRIVSEHYAFLWRSLRRLGVAEARAEDAAQQVLMVAARKLAELEVQRERAYLFAIVLRVAADERRSVRRHPGTPDEPATDTLRDQGALPDELLDQRRARAVADALIAELPMELRAVFVLAEIEEMTSHAIADLLSLPRGTVASRLRRARELFEAGVQRYQARVERRAPR